MCDSGRAGKYFDVGTINCKLDEVDNVEERHDLYSSSSIVSNEVDMVKAVFSAPRIKDLWVRPTIGRRSRTLQNNTKM
jgi:hypothetical protein